jgi:hypothetical protein
MTAEANLGTGSRNSPLWWWIAALQQVARERPPNHLRQAERWYDKCRAWVNASNYHPS